MSLAVWKLREARTVSPTTTTLRWSQAVAGPFLWATVARAVQQCRGDVGEEPSIRRYSRIRRDRR